MILRRRIMVTGGGDSGGYVDLGLPSGLMWAKGNLIKDSQGNYSIGAETDWGTYVSWGNIDGYNEGEGYDFSSTDYNSTPGYNVAVNIPKDDSVHNICLARLGAPWNLPTKEDYQELYDNTDFEWVADYNGTGVAGGKFMKKSDHSVYVFFPASGIYNNATLYDRGTISCYWSSSYKNISLGYSLLFSSSSVYPQDNGRNRYFGETVRPIIKPMFSITIMLEGEDVEGITVTVRDSEGISHSGITDSNGIVQLTGVAGGSAKVFTKDYYVTNGHITVNASSRTFTCGLEQRESEYLTFYSITNCTHKFTNAVNYSLDGGTTWQSLSANTALTVTAGNSVMWKATLTPSPNNGIGTFSVTDTSMRFDVEGNPMSLLYGDNFIGQTNLTGKNYAFYNLFSSNTGVVDAQNTALPATTLANGCYQNMFYNCSSLTTAPELPATTLADYCYKDMFGYCDSLTIAPELPATTLSTGCYYDMFRGCASLTAVPALPSTTLAGYCYYEMFRGCYNLTTAPVLPATTLAQYCYHSMFYGCSKLTTAPELPATTLATYCYSHMFDGCGQLTKAPKLPATTLATYCYSNMFYGCNFTTAPTLPATTIAGGCYEGMFSNCRALTTAPTLPATTMAGSCYKGMFRNCSKLTTAPALPATALYIYCYEDMFYNCTSLVTAPALPATTLSDYCYSEMFHGCTKLATPPTISATTLERYCCYKMFYNCKALTTAPVLLATTLVSNCYYYMFYGCSSLNYIKAMFTTTPSSSYTGHWVDGVAATGTFVKNSSATWTTTGVNGVPSGWTVETASS